MLRKICVFQRQMRKSFRGRDKKNVPILDSCGRSDDLEQFHCPAGPVKNRWCLLRKRCLWSVFQLVANQILQYLVRGESDLGTVVCFEH